MNYIFYFIFKNLLILQFVASFFSCILLFFVNAPYGKHVSDKFGKTMKSLHGWLLMEFPAFSVILIFYLYGLFTNKFSDGRSLVVMTIFILMWEIHYIHRTFVYPLLLPKKEKGMAILIPFFGMIFNTMNGYINGFYLFSGKSIFFAGTFLETNLGTTYTIEWLYDPRFIIGFSLFFIGMIINIHSDKILRDIKKECGEEYRIPVKGVHRLVASPNYFGEFIEWLGFAICTWSLPGFAFAIFTFANLAPRAWNNKKWYRDRFKEKYPKNRRAFIPFIF